jgi:hypothetical protein
MKKDGPKEKQKERAATAVAYDWRLNQGENGSGEETVSNNDGKS